MNGIGRGLLAAAVAVGIVSVSAQERTPATGGIAAPTQAGNRARDEWRSAERGRPMVLPADHASHPDYKLEWWYYTGNLDAQDGRRFGYQLTFFRIGVTPQPAHASAWAVRDLFMTHFAITDANGKRYEFAERLNRAGPGWAGASASEYHVWNDDWTAALDAQGRHVLRAKQGDIAVDLQLEPSRSIVLHGDHGYSQKGADPGNASHYYSLTRMPTTGTLVAGGTSVAVTGESWMDHEFGTTFLETGQRGWDWFALQLTDGRDLMLYRFRRGDGSFDPQSSGTLVNADGSSTPLTAEDFTLEPGRDWSSRVTGARYPIEWRVRVPKASLDLQITTPVDDQELHTAGSGVNYWEGAVDGRGTAAGRPVTARGYLEMTGYSGRNMADVLR